MEILLVLSNFFFCHYVFKKLSATEASESVYMREPSCKCHDVSALSTLYMDRFGTVPFLNCNLSQSFHSHVVCISKIMLNSINRQLVHNIHVGNTLYMYVFANYNIINDLCNLFLPFNCLLQPLHAVI